MWTVATAFNSSLTSDLFHMAIAESNLSGASVKKINWRSRKFLTFFFHFSLKLLEQTQYICIFLFVYFSNFQGRVEFDSGGYRQWEGTYEVAHYRYGMRNE